MNSSDHAGEAQATQRCDRADRAEQRKGATLPCRARRTEIGVSHDDEGKRVEWRGEPVMKFGAYLIRLIGKQLVGGGGIVEFPEVSFPHRVFDVLGAAREP